MCAIISEQYVITCVSSALKYTGVCNIQGGSNMTGNICV
jgi:hypothetical protein